ncbi:MAG: ZIP family metal transporter [Candidatus Poseidoniaceae archaeon]
MSTSVLMYALIALIIGLVCGLIPVYSKIKEDANKLKLVTGIAAGIIIASAMMVVIPEGYELATMDEHAAEEALAGSTALVILEVNDGDITAAEGIEEIEELLGGHEEHEEDGHDEHEQEGHEEEGHDEGLKAEIMHVIEEVEAGDINASVGISEIHELIATHSHGEEHEEHAGVLIIGGAILGGFILMLILEGSGIGHAVHEEHHDHSDEHGHGHVHHATSGWMLVFGLTLHAATDGLAIGAAAASGSFALTATVVLAVLIHKGPAAFSLGVFSMHERKEKKDSIRDVAIFSLATPIMMLIAYFALENVETSTIGLAMLFSAGTFLYVATVDTLPDIHNPESGKKAMIHVVIGVIIMIALLAIMNVAGVGHSH